jgi:hypothetical protein
MICPACGSTKVHRSHRKWYERPMKLIGVRPFRCHSCQHRFFSGKAERTTAKVRTQEPAGDAAKENTRTAGAS